MKRKRREPPIATERTTAGRRLMLGINQSDLNRIRAEEKRRKQR